MTRINCIPVQELTDRHLLAEYRELPRVFALARPCPEAPSCYTLGTGHIKFFYDKLLYLQRRQVALVAEMRRRGMSPSFDPEALGAQRRCGDQAALWNDWTPTPEAIQINRARIQERLASASSKQVRGGL